MHVICNSEEQTFALVPETPGEKNWRLGIIAVVRSDTPFLFRGRTSDGALRFAALGTRIELRGTTRDDWDNIEKILQICRISEGATGCLTFVGQGRDGQEAAIVVTGVRCAGCNKNMIDVKSCSLRMCASCRAKVPAAVH